MKTSQITLLMVTVIKLNCNLIYVILTHSRFFILFYTDSQYEYFVVSYVARLNEVCHIVHIILITLIILLLFIIIDFIYISFRLYRRYLFVEVFFNKYAMVFCKISNYRYTFGLTIDDYRNNTDSIEVGWGPLSVFIKYFQYIFVGRKDEHYLLSKQKYL